VAGEIAKAGDWGLDASEFDVPMLRAAASGRPDFAPDAMADAEVRLSLAVLKYARHARGGRFEPTDLTPYLDRKSPLRDPASVLTQIAAAEKPDAYLRKLNPQHPQFERLRQRYLAVRGEKAPPKGPSEAERLLANMEQWRWMPDDLGKFHVWVNIPEQLLRVVRDGRVINTERIVIGKPNAQTPIFSNEMKYLIFHPFWGVPDSIKTNEILPGLRRGRAILARQNLRLQLNGKDVDPNRFDWSRTDIRRFHVYQPPGRGNALGIVKFMFPNKHAVYMHDTPSKSLFKASVRAFSHGCMRVQDPVKFAELILAEDQGMSPDQVRSLAGANAPENNQINLSRHIPVHMVYFTMRVEDGGKVSTFKDIYGHEERIRLALGGKMNLIKPVEEPKTPTDPIGHLVEASPPSFSDFSFGGDGFSSRSSSGRSYSGPPPSYKSGRPDWARRVFSEGG
jgi:murein L,D-transpeptidase YcbB/YkuD